MQKVWKEKNNFFRNTEMALNNGGEDRKEETESQQKKAERRKQRKIKKLEKILLQGQGIRNNQDDQTVKVREEERVRRFKMRQKKLEDMRLFGTSTSTTGTSTNRRKVRAEEKSAEAEAQAVAQVQAAAQAQAVAQAEAEAEAEAEQKKTWKTDQKKPAKTVQKKSVAQKIFTCSICKKVCTDLSKFKRHLKRTHGPEDKFPCPSREQLGCLQMFKLKYSATVHNRIHTGEKYYKCNTCNARFCTSHQLKQHKK
ncbi:MAG: hypothetical protein GY795_08175 [Desulfobacterales bacterium]|nr:hypothetical protein [Desulfobacterales bacterium]